MLCVCSWTFADANANGELNLGESVLVSLTVHNYLATAMAPSYTLSSSSPHVTITDGMQAGATLVDDGEAALREATEHRVRLRVAVHAFAEAPFKESLDLGIAAADKARHAGDAAMSELSYRRRGLAIATLVILGFLVTLGVKIHRLPPPHPPET